MVHIADAMAVRVCFQNSWSISIGFYNAGLHLVLAGELNFSFCPT
jgi:hypothetical protein